MPFTAKHRDYLKIVLASKRISIKIGGNSSSGKHTTGEKADISENRPGDRAMREAKTNVDQAEEEEEKQMVIPRKFIKVKRRVP